jgi:single-stranded-DNA-specific exonuclease
VEEFRVRLRAYAAGLLSPADFERELAIDSEIAGEEITDRAVADVLKLAPFGYGNSSPLFAVRGAEVIAAPDIKKEKHLFARLRVAGKILRVKAWNFAHRAGELEAGARVDVAVQFEEDDYSASRGYAPWQAVLKDVRPGS